MEANGKQMGNKWETNGEQTGNKRGTNGEQKKNKKRSWKGRISERPEK